jgi:hypothetical protein
VSASADALNYPYIRVRSVEWLKRSLLIFPHIVRMSPSTNAPADDPAVAEFCRTAGTRGPLLRRAKLGEPHVLQAQALLIRDLGQLADEHGPRFMKKFERGRARPSRQAIKDLTVWERRLSAQPSFQIHRHKMHGALVEYLLDKKLAWQPQYSDGPEYVEMNPRLGEAVMATLAEACAENEGLRVVTEFPKLHGRLIGTPRNAILKACLERSEKPARTSGQQIAEFLVYRRCDVSALTAKRIAALKSERDALADFREELEGVASTLPSIIHSESTLEERLNDEMNDIFVKWQRDQANLSSFARRLFGKGLLKEPQKFAQELIKGVVKPEGAAAVAMGAGAAQAHLGGLTINAAAGAAAGFVVAIVFRAANVWGETKQAEKESRYRYLTLLKKHGVSFSLGVSLPRPGRTRKSTTTNRRK